MGFELAQNQNTLCLPFFLVSSADHITGLTGATPAVTVSKNGGTFAAPAGAVSEVGNGWYKVAGNATDCDTLGGLALHVTGSGADPYDDMFVVIASPAGDPWVQPLPGSYASGTAGYIVGTNLDATVSSRSTLAAGAQMDLVDAPNATSLAALAAAVWNACENATEALTAIATAVWASATRTITSLGANAADEVADAVWDETLADHTNAGTMGNKLNNTLSSGTTVAITPLTADGATIDLMQGDDYSSSTGQALEWQDGDASWPTLQGCTVQFELYDSTTNSQVLAKPTRLGAVGTAVQAVTVELTHAETAALTVGVNTYKFRLRIYHQDKQVRTLIVGYVTVRTDASSASTNQVMYKYIQ